MPIFQDSAEPIIALPVDTIHLPSPPHLRVSGRLVGKDYRLTTDMQDAARALQLPLASTAVTLRQAHADAPGQGTFVWNMGYSARDAADEINALFSEIIPEAVTNKVVSIQKGRGRKRASGNDAA